MAMQPGMDTDPYDTGAFDDVDLNSAVSPTTGRRPQHSTIQDVINSGLAAFRGTESSKRQSMGPGRDRGQSVGLMGDDDFAFDEDAFRAAQEDEMTKRLERVREVKRGLSAFKGWRVDIADLRTGFGGVFEA